MTDRELMELASKAAGLQPTGASYSTGFSSGPFYQEGENGAAIIWRPLHDDADAFRLAVKLRMTIHRHDPAAVCAGWGVGTHGAPTQDSQGPWFWKEWLRDQQDDAAATRQAIVQAAAHLGRTK